MSISTSKIITISIGVIFALFHEFGIYASVLSLSEPESISLTILLITALLWVSELIPLYVTSLAVLLMQITWLMPSLAADGKAVGKNDFLIAFFGDITLLFMGGFVLARLMNKFNLSSLMANAILRRTGTKPSSILLSIILVSAVLSMWMSNTATAAMMFAIVTPIVMKLPTESNYSRALALSIPFACNIGGIGTPIGTPPNAIAMDYLQSLNFNVTFSSWMLSAIPLMVVLLLLLWIILLKVYPTSIASIELAEEKSSKLTKRQWLVVGIFFLTVLGWLTSGQTGISVGTIGLMVVVITFGLKLLSTADFKNISWDILFMLGGGLCLGVGISKSGLTDEIANLIPMDTGFLVAFLILILLAAVMTTFMSNTATANLLIPVAVALPQGELMLAVAIALMCSTSMALPISTPPNAIAFGSGLIQSKDMIRSGLFLTLISMVGIGLTCLLLLPFIF